MRELACCEIPAAYLLFRGCAALCLAAGTGPLILRVRAGRGPVPVWRSRKGRDGLPSAAWHQRAVRPPSTIRVVPVM